MMRRSTLLLTTAALVLALAACQIPSTRQGGQRTTTAASQGRAQAGGVPSGTVVAYYGTDMPAGWILCDGRVTPSGRRTPDLRNRFILGLDPASPSALAEAGGTASHQHAADAGKPREKDEALESGSDEHAANDGHTHAVTVQAASHLPPYVKLVFIMKD